MDNKDKREVIDIINSEIKKYFNDNLDTEMDKLISSNTSKSRKEITKTIKDSMESVYKMLWQKRDFWKKDIK